RAQPDDCVRGLRRHGAGARPRAGRRRRRAGALPATVDLPGRVRLVARAEERLARLRGGLRGALVRHPAGAGAAGGGVPGVRRTGSAGTASTVHGPRSTGTAPATSAGPGRACWWCLLALLGVLPRLEAQAHRPTGIEIGTVLGYGAAR